MKGPGPFILLALTFLIQPKLAAWFVVGYLGLLVFRLWE